MVRLTLLTGLLVAGTAAFSLSVTQRLSAQAIPDPQAFIGIWEGTLDAGAVKLRLVFHVTADGGTGLSGTMDSPDQGAQGIPASSVTVDGETLTFAMTALAARYQGALSPDGTTLTGTFVQGGAKLPLVLTSVASATAPERPQNPQPPFPYGVEEVAVTNLEAGVTLAGTLTVPEGEGPFPGVVLVSGSGPQDRDETLMGHKPFLVLADHLTRHGVAVLRYDDRGVGGSTGDFGAATSQDFTSDALAAAAFLRTRPAIHAVGIVGHSEGGLVAPMAAVRSEALDFIVLLAGPGLPGEEIVELQSGLIARAEGTPESVVQGNLEVQRRLFAAVKAESDPETAAPRLLAILQDAVASLPAEVRSSMGDQATPEALALQVRQVNSPWFRFFLTYDPRPTLERVTIPVLALNGALDLQVPAEANLREIGSALSRAGNRDVTTRILPGLNHLFQHSETGSPSEYARIAETMNPEALTAVTEWILERFGNPR